MRRTVLLAVVALALTGCSSSTSAPDAAPTGQASTSVLPTTCDLKSTGDIIERVIDPGLPATAQELGSVDLANCQTWFDMLPRVTSTDPGFCTTAAWAKDNAGYNVDAVPAPPLKNIQAQAGQACGQG